MEENDLKKAPRIFLEPQGGWMKEKCEIPENLLQQEVSIEPESEIILIGPDGGKKKEKDDYSIPNLHNGLFRIHAFLHKQGINSVMLNCYVDNMKKAWEMIARYHPPFIAFSPYYDTMYNDLKNIEHALELSPNSIIIIGGFEASLNPQWRMLGGLVDIIIRGEGEFPLQEIIQEYKIFSKGKQEINKNEFLTYLKNNFKIKNIPAISILEKGKTASFNCVKERITEELYQDINLNAFQKHLDISPIGKYWQLSRAMFGGKKDSYFRFVTSDHCPFKCIFCQSSIYHSTILGKESSPLRYVTPGNIIKIIKAVSDKYPLMDIYIDDDNFLVNQSRAVQTIKMIIECKNSGEIRKDLIFQCRARTDSINPEICRLLKQAGFKTISVGSESYSIKELEYMKKKSSPEKNLNAIKMMLENGLDIAEDYLLYIPEVTADSFYENAKGICRNIGELGIDGSVNLFLSPLPSTELWGTGNFEKIQDFPYKEIFNDKIMFRNVKDGYEYIGTEIQVPKLGIILPHPEIVLVKDSLMRKASLNSLKYLPKTVENLKNIAPGIRMSRSFVTLSHLSAVSNALYELTNESRWHELEKEIERSVINFKKREDCTKIKNKKILLATWTRHDEPLGLMYLSSVLKKEGYEVRGIMTKKENIFDVIKEFKPDVIGYSAMTCEKIEILNINNQLKKENSFFSIIGGPLATFSQDIIEDKNVDALCIGEGEDAFLELLNALENKQDITKINNIHIKLNEKIYRNEIRPLVDNLDTIIFPDREIFKKYKDGGMYNLISSRGCPYSCTYCHNKKYKELHFGKGKIVRERSIGNVIEEMKQISKDYNPSAFFFQNDHFYLSLDVLKEFADKYRKELNIPFICALRPEVLNNEEYVKTLSEANCVSIFTGCEAGNDTIRKEVLKRNISKEQILRAAELSKKYGIKIIFQNMIGIPTCNFENDLETLQLNMEAKPFYAWASICSPYPGTEIYEIAKNKGIIQEDYEKNLQETYHFRSTLNISHKNKVDMLHKIFAVVVEYPEIFPILKQEEFYRNIDDEKVREFKKIFDQFKDYKYHQFENNNIQVPKIVLDFVNDILKKLKNK